MFRTIVILLSIALSVDAMVLAVFTVRRLKKENAKLKLTVEQQKCMIDKLGVLVEIYKDGNDFFESELLKEEE